jgi:hypothetical protein
VFYKKVMPYAIHLLYYEVCHYFKINNIKEQQKMNWNPKQQTLRAAKAMILQYY